jgi:cell surface protein SprA
MQIGSTTYLVDKRSVSVKLPNDQNKNVNWYLFRIPIRDYYSKVGNIPDFKSIRFIRMFLHNFNQPVVTRFARLELVRNQWRQFNNEIRDDGVYLPLANANSTSVSTGAVNIEENDKRLPVNYVSPCDVVREQIISNNLNLQENEQAMSLVFKGLRPKDTRGIFKAINYDLNQYKQMALYIHAETAPLSTPIPNDKLFAIVRIGNDFINNFYEVKIPLKVTPNGNYSSSSCKKVWPDDNLLDFDLDVLRNLKIERNTSAAIPSSIYRKTIGNKQFSIMGNPSLGEIRGILLAVYNSETDITYDGEIWFNELRLKGLNQNSSYAARGNLQISLADGLGSVNVAASMSTAGFGGIEQRVNERNRDTRSQIDISSNLELGKLTPKKWGLQIPVFASYSNNTSTPQYGPYSKDLELKKELKSLPASKRDSLSNVSKDRRVIKTLAVNNLHKNRVGTKKPKPWDIENWDASYAYNKTELQSPLVERDDVARHTGALAYNYSTTPKYWEPFKDTKSKFLKNKWLALIKDINFNPMPSLLSVRADVNRQFGRFIARNVGVSGYSVPESYNKYFTFDRRYDLHWELTKSLIIDYTANNNARVDEPNGVLNTKQKKDSVQKNFLAGGRNTLFTQRANATYTLPFSKFPMLDFIDVNVKYQTEYKWIGASRIALELGNIIENDKQFGVNAPIDFTKLYNKSKFLRKLDMPKEAFTGSTSAAVQDIKLKDTTGLKGKKLREARKYNKKALAKMNKKPKVDKPLPFIVKGIGKLATSVKRINLSYNETMGTRLPGYMDSTQYVGNNWKSTAPGAAFIFGMQPDAAWLNTAASKKLISKSQIFNELFAQRINQTLDIQAQLEPIRDLIIDVSLNKTYSKNFNELFKDTGVSFTGNYKHLGPFAQGNFSVSNIAFKTMFQEFDPNQTNQIFKRFEDYRKILSRRNGAKYPHYNQQGVANPVQADGYYYGYSQYATDVLIPSFVAAYTGQDPEKISLISQGNKNIRTNPFSGFIPKPNWAVTYNGLSRIKGFEKIFSNVGISHRYNSTLGMNNFNTALFYADTFGASYPTFFDTISRSYIPYFFVPNISMQESFEPLISIDLQFTNRFNVSFDYRKSRTVTLSLIDYQVSEQRSTQYGVRMDWMKQAKPGAKKRYVTIFGKDFDLTNDVRFQLNWRIANDATSNSKLDQGNSYTTAGQKRIELQPSIDYTVNKRVNLRFFYDRVKVIPNLASSSPVTTTRAGLEVRISLAD